MSDDFDPTDFDKGRRDPRRYMPKLIKVIGKGERGYQAGLRDWVAGLLIMTYAALESFDLFVEWRHAEIFGDNKKILSLTEQDYQEYAARCVVLLGCSGSDMLPSTRSKTLTIIKAFVEKGVEPEDCAEVIKSNGGFEAVYQAAKEDKARRKADAEDALWSSMSKTPAGTGSKKARDGASKPAKSRTGKVQGSKPGKRKAPGTKSDKPSSEPLTLEWVMANCLLVEMPPEELELYLDGPVRKDERRGLEVACRGRKSNGLIAWKYFGDLEVVDPFHTQEDNDNDNDNDSDDEEAA